VLIGYLIPIAYCLVASLGIWIFGFGGFPNSDFVQTTAEAFGLGRAPDWVVIALFVVLTGTTGMVSGVAVRDRRGDRLARVSGSGAGQGAAVHRCRVGLRSDLGRGTTRSPPSSTGTPAFRRGSGC
jgi:hypothetical protein